MAVDLELVPLRPADALAYRAVRLRALRDAPDAFVTLHADAAARDTAWWRGLLEANAERESHVIVARVRGDDVGMVCGTIEARRPDVCVITQMWVDPATRGGGVGRALLDAIVDWARGRHARRVELGVVIDNGPASRLYRTYGFVAFGEPYPLRPGSPILSQDMALTLTPL